MGERQHIIEQRRAAAASAYESDYYGWVENQLALLRAGRVAELDVHHLIEEVEDLGSNVYDKFESALIVVLLHMLKWDAQPHLRTRSWTLSIAEHRRRLEKLLRKNPSFRSRLSEAIMDSYGIAVLRAADETQLPADRFPATCSYDWDSILTRDHPLSSATD